MFDIKSEMSKLTEPITEDKPPYWNYWRRELWELAQTSDPANFMNWPVVYHNFLFAHWLDVIDEDFEVLQTDWQRWQKVVTPIQTGEPKDSYHGLPYSSSMIHQAAHLARLETRTGKRIDKLKRILEFGAGFGSMALAVYRAGFRGEYLIYDLPEVALLSRYFLEKEGVPVQHLTGDERPGKPLDLLLCMSSISEAPPVFRDEFLGSIKTKTAMFFYQEQFKEWDNLAYFHGLDLGMTWEHWHLESVKEMWYSLGVKK
jgi:hypothetical protein